MPRATLSIHPERRETPGAVRYAFDLRYSGSTRRELIFYEFAHDPALAPVEHFDGVLCAVIFHAMAERRDVRLHGPATGAILLNLNEYQLAWSRWLPDLYQPVEIDVESVIDGDPPTMGRSISAFSGGVDSSFTLLRNSRYASQPHYAVDTALLVHGFDVTLSNSGALHELIDRTRPIREAAGAQLVIAKTNSKELRLQNWTHSHAAQIAACMHLLSSDFASGLVGSGKSYEALVLRWGSNPVTDHLLSGGALKIVHDGAGFSRTEKVAFLSTSSAALQSLKVCWQGRHQGRNCGECEKCVRTQLNLLAAGVADAPCFDSPLDLRRIPQIPIWDDWQITELGSIVSFAERRNIDAEWLHLLRNRIGRGKSSRTLKQLMKRSLAKAGLLGAIRDVRARLTGLIT